ncbi:MAG: pknB, partial [Solirubrobacteraceae bacterium]|nr:pknB [Solirubrobacteraceae bacterium]
RALAKDPAERFPDADAFIAALEEARAQIEAGLAPPALDTAEFTAVASAPIPVAAEPLLVADERPVAEGPKWPWVLLISLLVVGAIVGALLLGGVIGAAKVEVPNVVRTNQATAAAVLHRHGLEVHFDPVVSDKPSGIVIGQDPAPGTRVKKGTTVNVSVSQGPGNAQVPVVTGLGRLAARKKLQAAHFKIAEQATNDPTVPKGHVISTAPAGGDSQPIGSTVTIDVSLGPAAVGLPDVTGQQVSDARATLTDAKFVVKTVDQQTTTQDPGTVISQSPAGGGKAPQGSTVTLTVARAPDQVAVPDVTGKLEGHAVSDLSAAGFTVDLQSEDTPDQTQDGRVLSQDPAGGTKAKPKTRVTVIVGHYVATATTPTPPTPTTPTTTPTTPPGQRRR